MEPKGGVNKKADRPSINKRKYTMKFENYSTDKQLTTLEIKVVNSSTFIELTNTKEGTKLLSDAIELGVADKSIAAETAMYAVGYALDKFQQAHKKVSSDIVNDSLYPPEHKSGENPIREAINYARVVTDWFKHYPGLNATFDSLATILYWYEADSFLPPYIEARRSIATASKNCTVKTYFIKDPSTGLIKIGRSMNPRGRLSSIQCGSGVKLELIAIIDRDVERKLHKRFAEYRQVGEWFEDRDGLIAEYIRNSSEEAQ